MHEDSRCPGFCGRNPSDPTNGSVCQACPWGWRVPPLTHLHPSTLSDPRASICEPCLSPLPAYDWLYLLFVAILPILINCFFVHYYSSKRMSLSRNEVLELGCCIVEGVLAAVASLLVMPPRWSLNLYGCHKTLIEEWYPALHNPQTFGRTLPCTYELVFPLYSLPFVYLLFCLMNLLICRSILYMTIRKRDRSRHAYYAALYAIPILALGLALMAGFLYYMFAFVLMLWSVAANAVHLSLEGNKSMRSMIDALATSGNHLTLLIVNMALLAFSIVTLAVERDDGWSLLLVTMVPVPAAFFLLTSGLSHPSTISST
ncbi:unnamed protein product, partial [Mesorhabditis belari]|uniref:JNK1/MAPK8-associated membrane protein n=1 Tax=Mesorhabditis belari TaxID=2138241 RepID=A0AAF3F1H3_9BILA